MLGLGFYMIHNTLQTIATQVAPEARGAAVSLFATSFFVAQAAGVYVGGIGIDRVGAAPLFGGAAIIAGVLGVSVYGWLKRAWS